MSSSDKFKEFAESCVPQIAQAIRDHDFGAHQTHFDPTLPDRLTQEEFDEAIRTQEEELGVPETQQYLGHMQGNQAKWPDSIRFVYSGVFSKGEAVIILSVHERNGTSYLHEHVYWW